MAQTQFASAERSERDAIVEQSRTFADALMFRELLDHVPDMVMILNPHRQIVYANRAVLEMTGAADFEHVLGQRPGELFHCKHSDENSGGCGTTRFCSCCGAVKAILESLSGNFSVEECRMTSVTNSGEEALDLRVWASPIKIQQQQFTFCVVVNIADEKRRFWLEKIFLHDLMNSATALGGFASLLGNDRSEASPHLINNIRMVSARLVDEIEAHRQLIAAENNEIEVRQTSVRSRDVLEEVFTSFNTSDLLSGRVLRFDAAAEDVEFTTDRTLLVRVIANMVKNGLEGSVPGEVVTLGCRRVQHEVEFWVHNPTYIPENVRLQIFNRSFSTKGAGRGLGTYSMKLLTEHFLGGRVSFSSAEASGTVFKAVYPITLGQPTTGEELASGQPEDNGVTGESPTLERTPAPAATSGAARRAAHQKTILLIDDEPAIHDIIHAAISKDIQIVDALTATDGLRLLQAMPFDLLLLDLNLPDIHGLDVLAQLRDIGNQTRVVVITADDTPEALVRAIGGHTYEYLRKPFTVEQLQELVDRALRVASEPDITVLSAKREWLELSIPCTRDAVERIEHFVRQLGSDLSLELLEPVAMAFRELLLNAVEWGGGLDPKRRVRISCLRGAHMLLYRIADPGPGFRFDGLLHSAAVNPEGVLGSTAIREEKGLRPGGLGIVMVRAIADELIYNKAQNEVVLVKYIS